LTGKIRIMKNQLNVFDTLATQNGAVLVRGETLNISQNDAVLANVFICLFFPLEGILITCNL
jgi:hypothetical protein